MLNILPLNEEYSLFVKNVFGQSFISCENSMCYEFGMMNECILQEFS